MSVETPDNQLSHLYKSFRDKLIQALAIANHDLHNPHTGKPKWDTLVRYAMFEGYRSVARQEWLYEQGRSRPGQIVTNDRVPRHHGYGLAADIVGYTASGEPTWDIGEAAWQLWGHAARAAGLEWGGNWSSFKDEPHAQIPNEGTSKMRPLAAKYLHSLGLSTP